MYQIYINNLFIASKHFYKLGLLQVPLPWVLHIFLAFKSQQ